jgi:type IV secretory pathway TraG/TraD family ATPase VirD4
MQSLSQLKAMYPQVWEDFFAAAGTSIFCNVNDKETAEYVSARLGTMTMTQGGGVPSGGIYMNTAGRPLMTLDEVTRFPKNMEIVLLQNNQPLRCQRLNCWEDPRFKGMLDHNPMHG